MESTGKVVKYLLCIAMNIEYRNNLPHWYTDLSKNKLILTNDIDSLASCFFLNKLFGCEIKGFYTFNEIYFIDPKDKRNYVGVDLDATSTKAKVFGNHVTYFQNEYAISLNRDITRNNYNKKFAGSTLITILSLYGFDISNLSEEQLEVLICIDTAFKQYYFDKELFKKYYADILEYPEFIDIVKKHDKEYFYKIIRKYKLHEQIKIKDSYLHTEIDLEGLSFLFGINLELPKDNFTLIKKFENRGIDLNKINLKKLNKSREKIFSSALVNKNFLKVSYS